MRGGRGWTSSLLRLKKVDGRRRLTRQECVAMPGRGVCDVSRPYERACEHPLETKSRRTAVLLHWQTLARLAGSSSLKSSRHRSILIRSTLHLTPSQPSPSTPSPPWSSSNVSLHRAKRRTTPPTTTAKRRRPSSFAKARSMAKRRLLRRPARSELRPLEPKPASLELRGPLPSSSATE